MLVLLQAFALAPSVFAFSGKTMYHYWAYDVMFWPKNLPVSAANYSKIQLDSYAQLPIDTLVMNPSLGFGTIAGNLKSSDPVTAQPSAASKWMNPYRNGMGEMLKSSWDPISETAKWCRSHKKEFVVALPINPLNVHTQRPDAKNPPNSFRCYLWTPFKAKNPDALMCGKDGKDPGGVAVDYTDAKVREKFLANAKEILEKYDLDGFMVDFMIRPTLFKTVAAGGTAAPKEVELITKMMTDVKAACAAASTRLGHKVSFGARVPDSVGYCQAIGIGLQAWFDTKLLDYVVIAGQFQLNRANVTGDLATKAGIPYYMSFTTSGIYVGNDSGYFGDDERLPRQSRQNYAARIADALLCKAYGVMYTQPTHHEHTIPNGAVVAYDAKANKTADKRYFVSYTNDREAHYYLHDDAKFHTFPSLISTSPHDLSSGIGKYKIDVWDDLSGFAKGAADAPKVRLATEVLIPSGMDTIVSFNGKELKSFKRQAGVQFYELSPALVKYGSNEVIIKAKGKNKRGNTSKLGNIAVEIQYAKKEGAK